MINMFDKRFEVTITIDRVNCIKDELFSIVQTDNISGVKFKFIDGELFITPIITPTRIVL